MRLKLFENSESNIYDIKHTLEDILLEVKDMNYYTKVSINPYLDQIEIDISMNPLGDHTKVFKYDDLKNISDTIMRIYDYMFDYYEDPFSVHIHASSIPPRQVSHTLFDAESEFNWLDPKDPRSIKPFDKIKFTYIGRVRRQKIKKFNSGLK
jgi:hypothetical protein